jgi:hypothetical protein
VVVAVALVAGADATVATDALGCGFGFSGGVVSPPQAPNKTATATRFIASFVAQRRWFGQAFRSPT